MQEAGWCQLTESLCLPVFPCLICDRNSWVGIRVQYKGLHTSRPLPLFHPHVCFPDLLVSYFLIFIPLGPSQTTKPFTTVHDSINFYLISHQKDDQMDFLKLCPLERFLLTTVLQNCSWMGLESSSSPLSIITHRLNWSICAPHSAFFLFLQWVIKDQTCSHWYELRESFLGYSGGQSEGLFL